MIKKIQKNILLNENYYIKDNKLFVDNIEIPFTKKNCKITIEYICNKCRKVHKQELHKHIPERIKDELLCTRCKVKQTNLEKYGSEYAFQSKEIKEKIKQTNLEKYGTTNPCSFGSIYYKNKIKEKYNVKNVSQLKEVKEKKKEIYLKKYGVENPSQSKEIQEKIKQTNLEKYNKEYYLQSDDLLNKTNLFRKTNTYKKFQNFNTIEPLFSLNDWEKIKDKYEKIKWRCIVCGNEFYNYYANGRIPRCLNCHPFNTSSSKGEQEISEYIKSLDISIIENDRSILNGKELDIYIPDKKIAIEFNGLYWHSTKFINDKIYHLNKTLECEKRGVQLLHIFEDEWMDKQDIVKNIIKTKFGIIKNKIGARKCELKEIDNQKDFLNLYHIQGYIPAKVNLGLYHEGELVSLLTFGKSRYNKKYDWEILRFVNKQGYSIVGGFSKMLKYFRNNYNGNIITYSDKRLFSGNVYESNGFTRLKSSEPSYFYTNYKDRFNRQGFMKHKLKDKLDTFDPLITEWQNMQMNGWDRIWDCGNHVFEYKNDSNK